MNGATIFQVEIDGDTYGIGITAIYKNEPAVMNLFGSCAQLDEVNVTGASGVDECLFLTCAAVRAAVAAREAGE